MIENVYHNTIDNTKLNCAWYNDIENVVSERWLWYLTFLALAKKNGVANLSSRITINSKTESPDVCYYGGDASAIGWDPHNGFGGSLNLLSGTSPSYNDGSAFLGVDDDSIKFKGGAAFEDPTGLIGQIGLEDIYFESIVKMHPAGTATGFAATTRNAGKGWLFFLDATRAFGFLINDGSGIPIYSAVVVGDSWCFVSGYVNRNEASTYGMQLYVNGDPSGSGVNPSGSSGSLSAENFTIGRRSEAATSPLNTNLAYFSMWTSTDWFQAGAAGKNELDLFVKNRFQRVCGIYPQLCKGTAAPILETRAYESYTEKVENNKRKYYYVGSGLLLMGHRRDINNKNVYGYLAEHQAKNEITESEDLSTTWSGINLASINSNSTAAPDDRLVGDGVVADGTSGQHGVSISATLTADVYTVSGYSKIGNKNWIKVEISTIANCWGYWDIANGAIGSKGSACSIYVEPDFKNDLVRWHIVFDGTAASHTIKLLSADDDNDDTFSGDSSTTNSYFWGIQCVKEDYGTTQIITSGGTSTRLKSQLGFLGDDGNLKNNLTGTMAANVLRPDYTVQELAFIGHASDGGSVSDRCLLYQDDNTSTRAKISVSVGSQGLVILNNSIADNIYHTLKATWAADNLSVHFDNISASPDTSVDIPDDLDEIDIAQQYSSDYQLNGLINCFRLHDRILGSE